MQKTSKLKMAIIGAGTWGERHACIYDKHPDVEICAICDLNETKAAKLAEKYSVKQVFTDHKEMLKHSGCDAVSIVTPDFLHAKIAIDCAEAKKDILIEKPLATKREDVFRIVDAFHKNNIRAMVDLHNRWNPPFAAAKQSIEMANWEKCLARISG